MATGMRLAPAPVISMVNWACAEACSKASAQMASRPIRRSAWARAKTCESLARPPHRAAALPLDRTSLTSSTSPVGSWVTFELWPSDCPGYRRAARRCCESCGGFVACMPPRRATAPRCFPPRTVRPATACVAAPRASARARWSSPAFSAALCCLSSFISRATASARGSASSHLFPVRAALLSGALPSVSRRPFWFAGGFLGSSSSAAPWPSAPPFSAVP
jgi:hypothetical protein